MSWFDAAGLANIAKSALKEAQRTIDKALDIKDEAVNENNLPVDINNDDIFGTWVVSQPSKNEIKDKENNTQNSVWGSFTGSFFDHSKEYKKSVSLEGLDDSADINSQHFSQSKLVVDSIGEFDHNAVSKQVIQEESNQNEKLVDVEKNGNIIATNSTGKSSDGVLEVKESSGNEQKLYMEDSCQKIEGASNNESCTSTGDKSRSHLNNENQEVVTETEITNNKTENEVNLIPNVIEKAPLPDAITVPPSRKNTQLMPINVIEPTLVSTQPQISQQELPELLRNTNIIDIPVEDDSLMSCSESTLELSTDEGSQSDVTIKATENNEDSGSDNEKSMSLIQSQISDTTSDKNSSSACVQSDSNSVIYDGISSENLSIIHLEMPPRDYSPLSSEKSDLVKIGSDHTSGHTSGDELETTTSSDIEIISSPNGDSSSTQSHRSPLNNLTGKGASKEETLLGEKTTKNTKVHNRELSETSSISDDLHSQDVEKLLKKIAEITEILESRESKIVEINRKNMELQELNMELKTHLNSALSKQSESQDLTQVTEEYAQRMSVLEKKFQQAIREKDTLRKELEQAKQESSMRLSRGDLDTIVNEKDEMIKQLREEGEKLSKQQLQHSNIIKKLRAKEKENETAIKQLKERLEDLTSENDRLKRTVNAKEEVERTQIEAVNNLTSKNKKLENDLAKVKSELDDQVQKYETLKKSLEAARKELNDKNKITNQLSAKEQMLEALENEKKVAESQSQDIINQLQYLRMKLHECESEYLEKEKKFRAENNELLKRLENAESRNEELSQSVLEVSKPLVRQLESLQTSHNLKVSQFEKIEMELTSKINELQLRLTSASNNERKSEEECTKLSSTLSNLKLELNSVRHEKELLEIQLDQVKTEKMILEQELKGKIDHLQSSMKTKNEKIEQLDKEIIVLKNSFKKSVEDGDPKDSSQLLNSKQDIDYNMDDANSNPRSNSPTLSVGKASVAESMVSSVWSQIESFDMGHVPRYTNMLEIQMLQGNLQQREGELQQLQWELNRREQERNLMNAELTTLTSKVEDLTKETEEYEAFKRKFEELQEQYDLLCQMYGEKVDEVEELKLDLLEAKEAYKSQLDELLKMNSS
ncbi:TATA element modulatory factor-like [Coccinella septempunctata]|uniref:TATA element modulatory factor-like n=1 Tax=Coccinella septempunctata TaxID=41139 RepID=UPI001D08FF04|nr:TATA element modulatory factor-like [Coccinella septempunctata]